MFLGTQAKCNHIIEQISSQCVLTNNLEENMVYQQKSILCNPKCVNRKMMCTILGYKSNNEVSYDGSHL